MNTLIHPLEHIIRILLIGKKMIQPKSSRRVRCKQRFCPSYLVVLIFCSAGIKPRVSLMLRKHSTTDPYPEFHYSFKILTLEARLWWFTPIILATLRVWDWEDPNSRLVQAKIFMRPHLNGKKLGVVAHICHPRASGKLKKGGLRSRSA
jgi:hypothetical protein